MQPTLQFQRLLAFEVGHLLHFQVDSNVKGVLCMFREKIDLVKCVRMPPVCFII